MIQISEERYQQLINAELRLLALLTEHPSLHNEKKPKLSSSAKKYKDALIKLVNKVEEVGSHPSFLSMFEISYVHGFKYDGPSFHEELAEAKKVLK